MNRLIRYGLLFVMLVALTAVWGWSTGLQMPFGASGAFAASNQTGQVVQVNLATYPKVSQ